MHLTLMLVRKLLRDIRWPLAAVAALLFYFSIFWVIIAQRVTAEIAPFFNSVAAMAQLNPKVFEEVMFKGPGRISQAVMGGGEVRFENPSDFLAVEMLHPVVLILTGLWAVGRAAGAVAGELDRGTMELLISQPLPRSRLIVAHFLVDCVAIPAVVLSIVLGVQAGLAIAGPFKVDYTVLDTLKMKAPFPIPKGPDELPVDVRGQWAAALNLVALMFAASGLAIAISSINRSRWKATGFAALVILTMFIGNVLGQLWAPLNGVRPLTFFYYYQPQKIWLKQEWAAENGIIGVAALFAVGFAGYLIANWRFRSRDLPAPL